MIDWFKNVVGGGEGVLVDGDLGILDDGEFFLDWDMVVIFWLKFFFFFVDIFVLLLVI